MEEVVAHIKMKENKQGAEVLEEEVLYLLMLDMIQTLIRTVIMVGLVNIIIGLLGEELFLKPLCIGRQVEEEEQVQKVKMLAEGQVMIIGLYRMLAEEDMDSQN